MPRTQEERRAGTRQALLDATTRCLVTRGYAGTTTTAVVQEAGVSQGALFKHFASKDELIVAAAEHLHDELIARYVGRFGRLATTADPADRLDRALRLLWQLFCSREMAAALELEAAARTDASLRAALAPAAARHAARIRAVAETLFPESAAAPAFHRAFDLVVETMHGMAASRGIGHVAAAERRLLDHLGEIARAALVPPGDHDAHP